MATPEMKAGSHTLSRAAGLVAGAKSDFDRMSQSLTDQITSLQGKWVGQGGSAFFMLHQAWTEKQTKIVSALNEFEAALQQTERDNTNTDDTQHGYMTKINGRLDGVSNY